MKMIPSFIFLVEKEKVKEMGYLFSMQYRVDEGDSFFNFYRRGQILVCSLSTFFL
jgi:hypothetical protein